MAAQVKSTLKEGGVRKPRIFCSRECTTRVGRRAAQGEVAKTVKLCVAVGAARRARSQVQRAAQHRWLQREAGMRKESRPLPPVFGSCSHPEALAPPLRTGQAPGLTARRGFDSDSLGAASLPPPACGLMLVVSLASEGPGATRRSRGRGPVLIRHTQSFGTQRVRWTSPIRTGPPSCFMAGPPLPT